jgi:hypothetical protein
MLKRFKILWQGQQVLKGFRLEKNQSKTKVTILLLTSEKYMHLLNLVLNRQREFELS